MINYLKKNHLAFIAMFISFSGACFSFTSAYINVNHVIEQKNLEKLSKNQTLVNKILLVKGEKIYDKLRKEKIEIKEAQKLSKTIDKLIDLDIPSEEPYQIFLYSHSENIKFNKIKKITIYSPYGQKITIEYNS